MLHIDSLPEATARVLLAVQDDPDIGAFILIGGTAIALHHGHRPSEDLDFCLPRMYLDRAAIRRIIGRLDAAGSRCALVTDENVRLYWENDGDDIDDHQQDWTVDGVKVTFFAADSPQRSEWLETMPSTSLGRLRILGSDGLFELKCRLLTKRTMSRDLFDIWFYCAYRGKTMADLHELARREDKYFSVNALKNRLNPTKLSRRDPGFVSSLPHAPKSFPELTELLAIYMDDYDRSLAEGIALDALQSRPT